jgi:hypothetical protein
MPKLIDWCARPPRALIALCMIGCGAAPEGNGDDPVSVIRTEQPIIPGAKVTQYYKTYGLPAGGNLQNISVSCPSGTTPVGGGYVGTVNTRVYASYGSRGSWLVSVYNVSNTNGYTFNVVIQCLSGVANSTLSQYWSVRRMIPPHASDCAAVECPSGILSGGGFSSSTAFRATLNTFSPGDHKEWTVCGHNDNPVASIPLDTMASCLENVSGSFTDTYQESPFIDPGNTVTVITTACPTGMLLSGAGYDGGTSTPRLSAIGSFRSFQDPTRWTYEFLNVSDSRNRALVRNVCLDIW